MNIVISTAALIAALLGLFALSKPGRIGWIIAAVLILTATVVIHIGVTQHEAQASPDGNPRIYDGLHRNPSPRVTLLRYA